MNSSINKTFNFNSQKLLFSSQQGSGAFQNLVIRGNNNLEQFAAQAESTTNALIKANKEFDGKVKNSLKGNKLYQSLEKLSGKSAKFDKAVADFAKAAERVNNSGSASLAAAYTDELDNLKNSIDLFRKELTGAGESEDSEAIQSLDAIEEFANNAGLDSVGGTGSEATVKFSTLQSTEAHQAIAGKAQGITNDYQLASQNVVNSVKFAIKNESAQPSTGIDPGQSLTASSVASFAQELASSIKNGGLNGLLNTFQGNAFSLYNAQNALAQQGIQLPVTQSQLS